MRFLFVMDPMETVLPDKDTTFAFQRAAQRRGHASYHCLLRDLFVRERDVFASTRPVELFDAAPCFLLGAASDLPLSAFDAVFIRKDPPFDAQYLYATLLLERARGKTLLINDPRGLRDANEKLYPLQFADVMPQTLVTTQRDRILAFVEDVGGRAVIKPLDGAGGAGVMLLSRGDQNIRSIIETITVDGRRFAMVQRYLSSVREGDKRVLLLDGKVLGGINRIPRDDDLRSNIHVGGRVVSTEVTSEEHAVVVAIAPRLLADGLYFVGLDFIGGKLTEVNVTSPTGIQELGRHLGRDVAEDVVAWTENRVRAARS